MFLELGEKLGAISHIVSFWRYRFAPGSPAHVDAEELAANFPGLRQRLRREDQGGKLPDQEAGCH